MVWTTIPNSNLEPGAPARSVDALALRDNPIAIANGDSGAPRVQTAGIADQAVTDGKLGTTATNTGRNWVLARQALATAGAVGTYMMGYNSSGADSFGGTVAGSNLTPGEALGGSLFSEGGSSQSGTWRCMGTHQGTDPGVSLYLRIS